MSPGTLNILSWLSPINEDISQVYKWIDIHKICIIWFRYILLFSINENILTQLSVATDNCVSVRKSRWGLVEWWFFHRLKIGSKVTNVAEINRKSIRGSVKTPKVVIRGAIRPESTTTNNFPLSNFFGPPWWNKYFHIPAHAPYSENTFQFQKYIQRPKRYRL